MPRLATFNCCKTRNHQQNKPVFKQYSGCQHMLQKVVEEGREWFFYAHFYIHVYYC